MSDQLPLALGRGGQTPGTEIGGPGFYFSACTTVYLRWDVWAYEFMLRLLLPERPALALDPDGCARWEYDPRRPRWTAAIPTIRTESESWLAGTRGNDPAQVRLEIINAEFFPVERLTLLDWMDAGCPLDTEDERIPTGDLLRDLDSWFCRQIMGGNLSDALEEALKRCSLPERYKENLLHNLNNYRKAACTS